ncbi:vps52 [Bugula neritina]|uniref:Vps52 n=1 Tax=Bugula neritina TaxID=10212 RepID=A0A7J7KP74_BUGNE|nr:vps52 [Bugula neritina]
MMSYPVCREISQLIRGFNADWKKAIDSINADIMRSFTNFKSGTQILQTALTQLIQFYHRLQKVMSQPPFRNWPIKNDLINIHNIMVEVKKHKFTF